VNATPVQVASAPSAQRNPDAAGTEHTAIAGSGTARARDEHAGHCADHGHSPRHRSGGCPPRHGRGHGPASGSWIPAVNGNPRLERFRRTRARGSRWVTGWSSNRSPGPQQTQPPPHAAGYSWGVRGASLFNTSNARLPGSRAPGGKPCNVASVAPVRTGKTVPSQWGFLDKIVGRRWQQPTSGTLTPVLRVMNDRAGRAGHPHFLSHPCPAHATMSHGHR